MSGDVLAFPHFVYAFKMLLYFCSMFLQRIFTYNVIMAFSIYECKSYNSTCFKMLVYH